MSPLRNFPSLETLTLLIDGKALLVLSLFEVELDSSLLLPEYEMREFALP